MKALILRGVPGSGKSTFAKSLVDDQKPYERWVRLASSDLYEGLYGPNGEFNPALLAKSHPWCFLNYVTYLAEAKATGENDIVVVDNTNVSAVEMAPYVLAAQAYGAELEIHRFDVDLSVAYQRNIHKVPLATIERMAKSLYEPLPPWWPQEIVHTS